MADITSANAVFTLDVPGVFTTPQVLQGFSTDDAFASDEVEPAEVVIGVDGIMSFGWLPFLVPLTVVFQADSPSIPNTMETWLAAQAGARQIYPAVSAQIVLPQLGKQYTFITGVVKRFSPTPKGGKILGPQSYQFIWNYWMPQPYTSVAANLLASLGL